MGPAGEINSSVADLLGAAGELVNQGESLSGDMTSLLANVEGLEGTRAWGGDDFGKQFLMLEEYLANPDRKVGGVR